MNARDSTIQSVQDPSAICWRMDRTMHFTGYTVPWVSRILGVGIVSVLRSIFMAGASCGLCDDSHFAGATPATIFDTRRHQNRPASPSGFLPATCATRVTARGTWLVVAVGAFYLLHACSVFFLPVCITPKHP